MDDEQTYPIHTTFPAAAVTLSLAHVNTCLCRYVVVDSEDVKLIDARCISAYVVPRRTGR